MAVRGGVRERIVFAGDITADRDVYAAMDVFVYPSIQGVFGIVVLEAMACGIPVVVSRLEGTDELVQHEHNGLLVDAADASGIADAVWRVGRDAALRQRLIQHGHDTMLRVGSDTEMARRYRAVYDAVLSR